MALALGLVAAPRAPAGAAEPEARPFESQTAAPETPLDERVQAAWRRHRVTPARNCSDAVFVRRVHLDLIGTLPEPETVRAFLDDGRPDRRARLVEALFAREEYADWWALRWCDALRVKSEFPINLWPNAVQAYHRHVREAIRTNQPYDRFVRELLTSSGSNFREPAVNFLRAVPGRRPADLAAAAALTFLGERIERWPVEAREGLAACFSRVVYKPTSEWKEEIVLCDPAPRDALRAVLPDGAEVSIPPEQDPREAFADWIAGPGRRRLARAAVNRQWAWFFGRGIVHEPDDLGPHNPPALPEALDHLADELIASGFDLRHVQRLIVGSRTYQQSPVPRVEPALAERWFASYPVRRLEAEAIVDALGWVGGTGAGYTSTIPEPWTFVPEDRRTISLADGSVTSPVLEVFGRPARDTGLASERSDRVTRDQRLYLLNSTDVLQRLVRSPRLLRLSDGTRGDLRGGVRELWLTLLSRYPTEDEERAALRHVQAGGRRPRDGALDVAWALLNSKEFLFRH